MEARIHHRKKNKCAKMECENNILIWNKKKIMICILITGAFFNAYSKVRYSLADIATCRTWVSTATQTQGVAFYGAHWKRDVLIMIPKSYVELNGKYQKITTRPSSLSRKTYVWNATIEREGPQSMSPFSQMSMRRGFRVTSFPSLCDSLVVE